MPIDFHNEKTNNISTYHPIAGVMIKDVTEYINNEDDENINNSQGNDTGDEMFLINPLHY